MSEHAPLPPSGAPQWGHCSAQPMVAQAAVNVETDATRAGTAGHWVVSECLGNWKAGTDSLCKDWVGQTAPNGVVIDETMAEGAQAMVSDVLGVAHAHGMPNMLIEHRVHMPQIHKDNWGTLDVAVPLLREGLIYLWDYKAGHRHVDVEGNLQLINYAAGLVNELNMNGYDDQHITVVFRIVAPFCYQAPGDTHEWRVKLSDLRGYFNQLNAKAHESRDSPCMSSGAWCRDCPAVGICAVGRKSIYNLIDYVNAPCEIDCMDNEAKAVERGVLTRGVALAKSRLEALEADLTDQVSKGAVVPGLALGTSYGREKYTIPVTEAIALASQFGVDAAKPGVLTPKQMKAAAAPALRAALGQVLKTVTERPAGGLKLINADDSIAARAFKKR